MSPKSMKMKYARAFSLSVFLCIFHLAAHSQNRPDDILGVWLTESKQGHVEVFKKNGKYFGKIIWMAEPYREDGTEKLDRHNPDPQLRNKKILGSEMLKNFVFDGIEKWEDGTIYDPNDGKSYSCAIRLDDQNTMRVRGYIGFSLIGKTQIWKRVEDK